MSVATWIDCLCFGALLLVLGYVARILLGVRAMEARSRTWRAQVEAAQQRVIDSGGKDREAQRQLIDLLRRGSTP